MLSTARIPALLNSSRNQTIYRLRHLYCGDPMTHPLNFSGVGLTTLEFCSIVSRSCHPSLSTRVPASCPLASGRACLTTWSSSKLGGEAGIDFYPPVPGLCLYGVYTRCKVEPGSGSTYLLGGFTLWLLVLSNHLTQSLTRSSGLSIR